MRGIFAVKIDEVKKIIVIDDLLNFEQTIYNYDGDGCLCPPPERFWIGKEESDELPWTDPLQQSEIEIYLDEIDFDLINSKYSCPVYEYFDFFSSYLRDEEI